MYTDYFGLTAEPFALTPDPRFLYLSPSHAEALAALKIGVEGRRGFVVMTGEVGTGKTTLLYSLLSELGGSIHTAYVSNSRLRFEDMLRLALADFGVATTSTQRADLLTALNAFLQQCAADGTTAALVVDEAQNLDDDTFENLRLLSNYESFTAKLLQIVLVGQPELAATLQRPQLRQLSERVAVRCHIAPLGMRESSAYIAHRLRQAGGTADLFTAAAQQLIVHAAAGLPRRINILCHNALLFAYGRGVPQVTRPLVRAAVRAAATRPRRAWSRVLTEPLRQWLRPALAGAGVVAAVAGATAATLDGTTAWRRWWSTPQSVAAAPGADAVNPAVRQVVAAPAGGRMPRRAAGLAAVAWPSRPPVLSVETVYAGVDLAAARTTVLSVEDAYRRADRRERPPAATGWQARRRRS